MHRKHVICFIDDDPQELQRFRANLNDHFEVAIGTSVSGATEDLKKQGFDKPDLFLLDLYYPEGPTSSAKELEGLAAARHEFLLEGLDAGAVRIIKKPDPSDSELRKNSLTDAYDEAFRNNAHHVIRDIEDAIRRSTWWWKHKEAVFAYFGWIYFFPSSWVPSAFNFEMLEFLPHSLPGACVKTSTNFLS
jgi:hypothetical protein